MEQNIFYQLADLLCHTGSYEHMIALGIREYLHHHIYLGL